MPYFLLLTERVHAADPLSVPIGQRIPTREAVRVLGPYAAVDDADTFAGYYRGRSQVVSIVRFQGDLL